jgi:hypothetical protein
MREQIISETCIVLGAAVKRAADSLNGIQSDGDCRQFVKTVGQVVSGFRRHSVSSTEHSSVAYQLFGFIGDRTSTLCF